MLEGNQLRDRGELEERGLRGESVESQKGVRRVLEGS